MDRPIYTTPQCLASRARQQPHVRAITGGGIDCSYCDLAVHVVQVLDALAVLGIRRGQVVGVEAGDRFLHLLLLLACEALGAATITLSPFELAPEVDLGRFCDRVLAMQVPAGVDAGKVFVLTQDWLVRVLQAPVRDDRFGALAQPADPDSLVRLIKSSGTTGVPKVMGLTHRVHQNSIRNNLWLAGEYLRSRADYLCLYPFSVRGCHARAMQMLQMGGTIHFAAMEAAAAMIMAGSVNYTLFVSGDLDRFVRTAELSGGPFGLHVDVIGGAVSPALRADAARLLTDRVMVTYGTNEIHYVSVVGPDDVGVLLPGVEVMVVDDEGLPVPAGESGLILVRSDTMVDGYLGAPALTAAAFVDGWYHTSDVGFQPSPGSLVVQGRADGMLNVGGMKVPPGPVVEQIRAIDGVLDAMVTNVVNARGIEVLLVAVETGSGGGPAGLEAAINPIIQRYASRYVLLPMDEFPRTETRKIRQDAVRAAYAGGGWG
ncbi:class I adenylate-forming enzyme family protein [Acidisphaera sp. S103]|uniref:class I adenylate-forming enzyme family protein n=1 Tax=Acidisphaera sp. S103 TaxID=1747223 RepID=UPI00131DA7C2|nr:class I adenylate-forming enzyme family protein [Acidisphaera sp. S103]